MLAVNVVLIHPEKPWHMSCHLAVRGGGKKGRKQRHQMDGRPPPPSLKYMYISGCGVVV